MFDQLSEIILENCSVLESRGQATVSDQIESCKGEVEGKLAEELALEQSSCTERSSERGTMMT